MQFIIRQAYKYKLDKIFIIIFIEVIMSKIAFIKFILIKIPERSYSSDFAKLFLFNTVRSEV